MVNFFIGQVSSVPLMVNKGVPLLSWYIHVQKLNLKLSAIDCDQAYNGRGVDLFTFNFLLKLRLVEEARNIDIYFNLTC